MLTPRTPPPEDYYQNNWRTLLSYVVDRYSNLLSVSQREVLNGLLALGDDAQRLCARVLTRKGPILREDSLNYAEIGDTEAALAELAAAGVIKRNASVPADRLLKLLRKDDLLTAFAGLHQRQRKAEMCQDLLSRHTDQQLVNLAARHMRWLQVSDPALWDLVKLLYFGDASHDWSAFVIRDLGMVRYEPVPPGRGRFSCTSALAEEMYYRKLAALSRRLDDHPALGADLITALAHPVADRFIEQRRQRALLRLGRWYERQQAVEPAVEAYARAFVHPARERIVRSLHRDGQQERAAKWLGRIGAQPQNDDERQFVERFGKRGAGYQPPVTEIEITQARPDIEQQALELILQPGEWGAHVENSLFRSLTGLLYWPAVFADVPGAFTNPFQFGPNDLYHDDFAASRREVIEAIEAESDASIAKRLRQCAEEKNGVASGLVNWQLFDAIDLDAVFDAMPVSDIRRMAAFFIRNLRARRAGLPDLFIARGSGCYELVEVKGPTDQLQPNQRVWLRHLAKLGIPARVVKLRLAG